MKPSISLLIVLTVFAGLHQAAAQTTFAPTTNYVVGTQPQCVIAADVNGDGNLDLIAANIATYPNPGTLTVLTNNGSGHFALASSPGVDSEPDCVVTADVNGDGRPDLISANLFGTLSVLINTSTFPPPTSVLSLTLKRPRNGILVSWASASAGWSLQQNPDLATAN